MNDVRTRVERLLETLTAFGRPDQTEQFRQQFERSNWLLHEGDLAALQAALTHGLIGGQTSSRPPPEFSAQLPPPAQRAPAARSELPNWLAPLSQHEAYLHELDERLPSASLSLIERVNALLGAASFSQFYQATRDLFVEEFRFDDLRGIDELPRLPSLHSFSAIRRVAVYDELPVFVVEDRYGGPHHSLYNPLFQLSHRCIVLAFHPALRRSRIVFRGHDTVSRYRTLVGRVAEREGLETLLTLARRFSSLRPNGVESGRDVEKRARRAFAQTVEVLVDTWSPNVTEDAPAGAPWRDLISREVASFISRQTCPTGYRLHIGLEAAFRNRFPIPVAAGAARLNLVDWQIVGCAEREGDRWNLIATRATRSVNVRLTLQIAPLSEPTSETCAFDIDTVLPLPDENGELIIDGTPGQLCFHVDQDGADYVIEDEWREPALELDDDDLALGLETPEIDHSHEVVDSALPAALPEAEAEEPASDHYSASSARDRNRLAPRTCSLGSLWTFLVERRLAALALCLWRSLTVPTTASQFLSATRNIRPRGREFPLAALGHLWRHVRPSRTLERVTCPVVRMNRDVPPAWACLEAARHDPDGYWVPIASARLHPGGGLAIPVSDGLDWRLSLCAASAHEVQGRWNEGIRQSDPRWWVCDALQWFAGAAPGTIAWPLGLLRSIQTVSGHCVVGDRFRILVTEAFLSGLRRQTITSMRVCDIPAPVRTAMSTPPRLLVAIGERASGGDAWLAVSAQSWNSSAGEHVIAEAYRRLTDSIAAPSRWVNMHLGPDEHGVVSAATLVERWNPSGRVDAWRAAVQLRPSRVRWVASLQDGRAAEVEVVRDEDMPFDQNGTPLGVCVLDPLLPDANTGAFVFAPDSGELLGEASEISIMVGAVCPWADACPPDVHLRYRTLDGEGVPADGSAPQITDDWRTWLAAAEPEQALICDAVEQGANAGVPPALAPLHDLAMAVRSSPLPFGPDLWRATGSDANARYTTPYDPTPRTGQPARPPVPERFAYRCTCGACSGQKYTSLRCPKCHARVARAPVQPAVLFTSTEILSESSIHPWRKPAVAALCGLSTDELDIVLQEFSGREVCQQILQLDGFPGEPSFARLARGECTVELRAELENNCEDLQQCLQAVGSVEEFLRHAIVSEVRVPLMLERLTGRPPGASELQAPSALLKLRHVRAASTAHAQLCDVAGASCASRLALNRALDQLFGARPPQRAAGDLQSFRSWIHRLLPPLRLVPKAHALPGLFRTVGGGHGGYVEQLRYFGVTEDVLRSTKLPGSSEAETSPRLLAAELHLATRGAIVLLQRPARALYARDLGSWRAQWAYRALYSRYQLRLAALAAATESLSFSESEWVRSQWPPHVDRGLVGQIVLRHLWSELRLPASQPAGLLTLLCNADHQELPADPSEAEQRVAQRLILSLPSRTGLGDFVRMALARVLCGWSRGDVAAYRGVSVRWSSHQERAATRFIPGDDSFAWKLLPGSAPLLSTERWLLDGPFDKLSPVVCQLMRWGNYPVAPRWESGAAEVAPVVSVSEADSRLRIPETPETAIPSPEHQVEPGSSNPKFAVSLYEESIRAWLS